MLIAPDIYWNSAWQKLRSPQFRTGLYLAQWIHVYAQVKDQLSYRRQHAVPAFVRSHTGNLTDRDIRLWRLVAATAITAEIALPPTLLIPQTMPYAVAAGIAMHRRHLPHAPPAHHLLRSHPRQLPRLRRLITGRGC
ncbi:hypothetical protein ABZ454_35590 [Streptomyces sp. NPDC005803]|uniref:hypothetical protein n=1 Tax=Streptomyces sp. NPDC005803 TaxID=3154297 RepID=UPI0033EA3146